MTRNKSWGDLAARLVVALKPIAAPIGIAFVRRARTGMRADEMTCALPAVRLAEIVDAVESAA